jgi:excisionase family DNA binding protein
MERLTVNEAANRLGISQGAVRKRIQRGTIPNAKRPDGSVYVFLDADTEHVSRELEPESDEQKTLHYIDKLYSSWQSVSTSGKRIDLTIVLISLLLLVLSGSQASGKQQSLTISGIGLKIPFVVFLIAGAVGLVVLIGTTYHMTGKRILLERKIVELYKRIGVDESDLVWENSGTKAGLFEYGNFVDTFTETLKGETATSFAQMSVYLTLPVAGQVAAVSKVAELLQKQGFGWVWILSYLLPATTCVVLFWTSRTAQETDAPVPAAAALFVYALFGALPGAMVGFIVASV